LRSWLEVFGAKQGYEQVAEKGDGERNQTDVFEHFYSWLGTLFEPFAGAKIQNRGGEEGDRCKGENGVVHRERIEGTCLGSAERWIRISLDRRKGEAVKQRRNEVAMEFGSRLGRQGDSGTGGVPKRERMRVYPLCFWKSVKAALNQ
jgi:hypothetical protein